MMTISNHGWKERSALGVVAQKPGDEGGKEGRDRAPAYLPYLAVTYLDTPEYLPTYLST